LMLLLILFFNKEIIIVAYQRLINYPKNSKVPLKRKLLTIGITIIVIVLIFSFDYLIEYWLGASKEKIIE